MRSAQWKNKIGAMLGATLALAGAGTAQSITPDKVVATIRVGQTFTIKKTITLGASGATNVDLFFLADNTGSMGGIVNNARNGANAILNNFGAGFQYGVGRYLGDPSEGVAPADAYEKQSDMTSNKVTTKAAIDAWFASGGGDTPEAGFFALKGVAESTTWRGGAQRVVVWFGDATSHTATVTEAQAIAALQANGVKVVAFNSLAAGRGIDDTFGGSANQASKIVAGAGGSLTNNFSSLTPAQFVSTVNSSITAATSTIDLNFFHTLMGMGGLDISFRCTDVLGCLNVGGGQSRTFEVDIKGLSEGIYNFNIGARGVDALENDIITVIGTGTVVPEPATVVLMGTGLLGLAGIVRRRRNSQAA